MGLGMAGAAAPRRAAAGGPVVGGDGERVGEHRWRPRELAAGVVGHEGGRRSELRGELEGGGGHGGGGDRSRRKGRAGLGSQARAQR